MTITFRANKAEEHELGTFLGRFQNNSDKQGYFEFYFSDQDNYLELKGNDLYLEQDWQYDFETENIFTISTDGVVSFYDFSDAETPIKFVDQYLNYDWIYADLEFVDIDEGALTYDGWQSPWAPTQVVEKSGVHYIDAILLDTPEKWNSDTFYHEEFSENLLEDEIKNIKLIIERLTVLEKASEEKLTWAHQFTNYLQATVKRK